MVETASEAVTKAAAKAKKAPGKAATTAKKSAKKATGTARATKAARAGLVVDARQAATEAGLGDGMAAEAIARVDALHYEVEVNKRGLSVKSLTRTLNERWDNGWRLAHVLEQRGNTVLVFEKRS
jgi:hypothetical protein